MDLSRGSSYVVSLLHTIGATAANITEAPLYFKELIICDTYNTPVSLSSQILKNYTRQGILQFYKLLGSSDLIGNPIGLVDKLGTGVIEFFNEPRKGLLKGPKEFAMGIGKGVRSLATNVVAGGFQSVSRISGSLYTVVK